MVEKVFHQQLRTPLFQAVYEVCPGKTRGENQLSLGPLRIPTWCLAQWRVGNHLPGTRHLEEDAAASAELHESQPGLWPKQFLAASLLATRVDQLMPGIGRSCISIRCTLQAVTADYGS